MASKNIYLFIASKIQLFQIVLSSIAMRKCNLIAIEIIDKYFAFLFILRYNETV